MKKLLGPLNFRFSRKRSKLAAANKCGSASLKNAFLDFGTIWFQELPF